MASLVTIANLEKKVPFYPTSNVLKAIAADADIRNGPTKKSPDTYFQASNKNHADNLAGVKLAEIVNHFNSRRKNKQDREAGWFLQREKVMITNPGEKKGGSFSFSTIYKQFSAVGVADNELKVIIGHDTWGKHPC